MAISTAAANLILREEIGSAGQYTKLYTHFDWPGGASGPTIGIGYDLGYCTPDEIANDWGKILTSQQIAVLQSASGRRGALGSSFVYHNRAAITVTFEQALAEFNDVELTKWEAITKSHLPNFDELPGNCGGTLVSLAYNRGPSFDLPGSQYYEMRQIKAHMIAKEYAKIPAEFVSMKRLWAGTSVGADLCARRDHEAALFQIGLDGLKTS